MTRSQALAAIKAAGIKARLVTAAEPACEDDEFVLTETASVQISADRRYGLVFCASVEVGEGDDWGIIHGHDTSDPVAAAREALVLSMRACLDLATGDGGRIVVASEWLYGTQPPLPQQLINGALDALARNQTYSAANGAWSLTPLED